MTDAQTAASGSGTGFKTIGVKLPDAVHAQLTLVASLDGLSLTDAIRQAIDAYIAHKAGEGDMAARAAKALEDIEREAAQRRGALEALFGHHVPAASDGGTSRRRSREASS